jgi:hypothetical protein
MDGASGSVDVASLGDTLMRGENGGVNGIDFLAAPGPVDRSSEPFNADNAGDGKEDADEAGAPGSASLDRPRGPASAQAPVPVPVDFKKNLQTTFDLEQVKQLTLCFKQAVDTIDQDKKYGPVNDNDKRQAAHACAVKFTGGEMSAAATKIVTKAFNLYVATYNKGLEDIKTLTTMPLTRRVLEISVEVPEARSAGGEKTEREGAASGAKTKRGGAASGRSTSRRTAGSDSVHANKNPFNAATEPHEVKETMYSRLVRTILTTIYTGVDKKHSATQILADIRTAVENLQTGLAKEYKEATNQEYEEATKSLEELAERLVGAPLYFSNILPKAKDIFNGTVAPGKKNFSELDISPGGGLSVDNMCEMVTELRLQNENDPDNADLKRVLSLSEMTGCHVSQEGRAGRFFTWPLKRAKQLQPKVNTRCLMNDNPTRATDLLRQFVAAFQLDVPEEKIKAHAQLWVDIGKLAQSCRYFLEGKELEITAMTPDDFAVKYPEDTAVPAAAVDISQEASESSMQAGAEVPVAALRTNVDDDAPRFRACPGLTAAEDAAEHAAEGVSEGGAEGAVEGTAEGGAKVRAPKGRKKNPIVMPLGGIRRSGRVRKGKVAFKDLAQTEINCTPEELAAQQDLGHESDWDAEMQDSNDGGAASASGPTSD